MKVKDLIKKLSKLDSEKDVMAIQEYDNCDSEYGIFDENTLIVKTDGIYIRIQEL